MSDVASGATQQSSQPTLPPAVVPSVHLIEASKPAALPKPAAMMNLRAATTVSQAVSRALRVVPVALYPVARLRPAGIVGAAGVLAAITLALITVFTIRNSTHSLEQQIAQAKLHPAAATVSTDTREHVMSSLPTREQMPVVVEKILQQATAAGVALETGHYAYTPPKGGTVGRYEVEFPVKADYPSVRGFIDRTLTAVPAAGLDRLRVERKAVGENVVKADVRFVIFVRNGVSP